MILHEREIRQNTPPFDIIRDAVVRERFMERLNSLILDAPFEIVASVIMKNGFKSHIRDGSNPYHVALEFGLERVYMHIQGSQRGKKTHVIFESRGKKEDAALELEFRRIMDKTAMTGMADTLEFRCVSKAANSSGLQLADMVARPIGTHLLHPEQANRAWDLVEPKLRRSWRGQVRGYGLKVYP